MLARSTTNDFNEVCEVINDAASAYKGVIPADRWHEPYVPEEELKAQIDQDGNFWSYKEKISTLWQMQLRVNVLFKHCNK